MLPETDVIPVLIVSYRTPGDLGRCLAALDAMTAEPSCAIYICENGGSAAWETLRSYLLAGESVCFQAPANAPPLGADIRRVACLRMRRSGRKVFLGEARENLGYAGGINAWLMPLLRVPGWSGCWILNPDAVVEPDTLHALVAEAALRGLGMVGSRIIGHLPDTGGGIAGLRWQRFLARTLAVEFDAASSTPRAPTRRITSPSGASVYMTRDCIAQIAPLDPQYFLYFEDLDWGVRASRAGYTVGCAYDSAIVHEGGGSTGAEATGRGGSDLAVYLQFRNRLVFVRAHYAVWLPWAVLLSCLHALRMLAHGVFRPAARGVIAGLLNERGRPDKFVDAHSVPAASHAVRTERRPSAA
jgi:GT2 family glycosyltransferase